MKRSLSHVLQAYGIFVIIALVFGITFIKITPPLWGIDEITHFNRVYQLAGGGFVEHKIDSSSYGGKLPTNLIAFDGYVYLDLQDSKPGTPEKVDSVVAYNKYDSEHFSKVKENTAISGVYTPIAYLAPTLGVAICRLANLNVGHTIFVARLFTLLLYVGLVFLALWIIRNLRARWLVFAIALIPMALFQASIVSVDSVAIGLSLLLFSLIIAYWQKGKELTKRQYLILLTVAILLALTKANYALLGIIGAFLPSAVLGSKHKLKRALIAGLPLVLAGAWTVLTAGLSRSGEIAQIGMSAADHISLLGQTKFIFMHPFQVLFYVGDSAHKGHWLSGTFGLLGWNYVYIPEIIICILVVSVLIGAFYKDESDKYAKLWHPIVFGLGCLTLISVIYAFYVVNTPVGKHSIDGVQGRYFLPILPFIFYGLGRMLPIRVVASKTVINILIPSLAVISLFVSVVVYFKATY